MIDRGPRLVALQAVPKVWLEQTQTWIYTQIMYLPAQIESHVLCEATANLDQFPFPRISNFAQSPRVSRIVDRAVREIRVRRHLGFAARTAARVRPHIIHSHFGPTGWEMLDVADQCGAKHIVSFYGLDVNYLPKHGWLKPYQDLFERIDRVLCEGPHMGRCIAELGCSRDKISVHRLGVRVDEIECRPRGWQPSQRLRVLMAASFREKKGLPYAIEALGALSRSVDLEATIIGGPNASADGQRQQRRINEAIETAGLRKRVVLLGFQPVSRLMKEAYEHHVFLAPSVTASNGDTEGGAPITIIEMAASGMPIVSTTHCDIPEVIVEGETGYLAAERDVDGLATKLEALLANARKWPAMLESGRRRIETLFNASTQGEALGKVYNELANPS